MTVFHNPMDSLKKISSALREIKKPEQNVQKEEALKKNKTIPTPKASSHPQSGSAPQKSPPKKKNQTEEVIKTGAPEAQKIDPPRSTQSEESSKQSKDEGTKQTDLSAGEHAKQFQKRALTQSKEKHHASSHSEQFQKRTPVTQHIKKEKKSTASHADVAQNQMNLIYLVKGTDRGHRAWHYVQVQRKYLHIFLKKTQGGTVDVSQYGKILYSGWGETPPEEITKKIQEEYS